MKYLLIAILLTSCTTYKVVTKPTMVLFDGKNETGSIPIPPTGATKTYNGPFIDGSRKYKH